MTDLPSLGDLPRQERPPSDEELALALPSHLSSGSLAPWIILAVLGELAAIVVVLVVIALRI